MSQRGSRGENAAKNTERDKPSLVEKAAKARMARITGAGLSGLQASAMAFVIGGCLALGFFAGSWLDRRLGTTYWMPIGVFVGLAAGVRDMFRSLRQLNAQTQRDLQNRRNEKQTASVSGLGNRVLETSPEVGKSQHVGSEIQKSTEPETIRPRIFHVPPPPAASFEMSDQRSQAIKSDEPNNSLEVDELRALLGEDGQDDSDQSRKEK